jgi:integrase
VHWQAGDRPVPAPSVSIAGESVLWVGPSEIPSDGDIGQLGRALAGGAQGERHEPMANVAAYSGLRWGEIAALTIAQVDQAARVITVDRKVVELPGGSTSKRRRTASTARRSTRAARPPATRSPSGLPPGSRRPAPSRRPGPTRSA